MDYEPDGYQAQLYPIDINSAPPAQAFRGPPSKAKLPPNAIKILMMATGSDPNRKLLKFFGSNLNRLNDKGLYFDWIEVHEDEMDYYLDQDIGEFPMMLEGAARVVGARGIIRQLRARVDGGGGGGGSSSNSQFRGAPPAIDYNNFDVEDSQGMHDYMNSFMTQKGADGNYLDDDDPDEAADFKNNAPNMMHAMTTARKINGQASSTDGGAGAAPRRDNLASPIPDIGPMAPRANASEQDLDNLMEMSYWENMAGTSDF